MFKPLDDIVSASSLLSAALKQYHAVCSILDPRADPIPKSLSHLIENELMALDSYEITIRRAKSAICRAKNYSPAVVPINSLPSEVLSHIFILVRDRSCPSYDWNGSMSYGFPKCPDIFLRVCSRWRQVAISSCKLWSHIDIIPRYISTAGHLARAEAFVALAGQSPLELHIGGAIESDRDADYLPDTDTPLFQFISSIAPRLQSLELITHSFSDFYLSILEACFIKCTSGILTRLAIQRPNGYWLSSDSESYFGFIDATDDESVYASLPVDIPRKDLEALWGPIEILCVCGIYPQWSSKAYHGLVELRLPGLDARFEIINKMPITEAQLVGILQSSPQLRILHLGIKVHEPLPKHAPIIPVSLNNLEVLDLSSSLADQNGTLLRWIAPGPKPPIVALRLRSWKGHLPDDETREFLARSRSTKLIVSGHDSDLWLPDLLLLPPYLQTLVFRGLGQYPSYACMPARVPDGRGLRLDFRPNYLNVILCRSQIDLKWLRWVLERRPIQSITLWASRTYRYNQIISNDEVESELLQVCSIVRTLDSNELSPIEN